MKKNSFIFLLSGSFLTNIVLAGTMGPVTHQSDWNWVGTLSAGPVWEGGGKTQTFYLTADIEKTYTANQSIHVLFDGEVFAGLQKKLSPILQGQLGLAVAATSNAVLSGHTWDDADPTFDNYTYGYNIQHTHLAIKGKLLADLSDWFTPWLSGSLGVGFNNAHRFNNTPLSFEAIPNSNFASHTETAFTYTVGAGLQRTLNTHWQVGVGYEFADWGKSQLNRASEQTLNKGLTLSHVYTNGVLFNLTYLA